MRDGEYVCHHRYSHGENLMSKTKVHVLCNAHVLMLNKLIRLASIDSWMLEWIV